MNLPSVISRSRARDVGARSEGIGEEATPLLGALGLSFEGRQHEGVRRGAGCFRG